MRVRMRLKMRMRMKIKMRMGMRMRFPTSHTRHLCAITIFRKDPEENPYKSKYIAREMLELAVPGN